MAKAQPSKFKLPSTLGACADLWHDIREERLRLQKLVDAEEAKETTIREHFLRTLSDSEGGAVGLRYKVTKDRGTKPVVKDWDAFWKYVLKNKATEFLQRRVSDGAIQERWDAGKQIPGVEPFQYVKFSLTKV